MENKKGAFEYVQLKLDEWFKENNALSVVNDLSVLKSLKLLFFVSAIDTYKDSTNTLLDQPFNNFVAMPYGHVESDIYNFIKTGDFDNISIDSSSTIFNNRDLIKLLDSDLKDKIDVSIEKLKKVNSKIINFTSFELVELSHRWFSWQNNYKKAQTLGSYSHSISIDEIKSEDKFYQI